MRVFLCHHCHVSSEPSHEGMSAEICNCGRRMTHYITWDSPGEDAAAALLIERELARASGGLGGTARAKQALADSRSAV